MTWVKLDDQFTDHPKVIAVGPTAAWLYVCGLTYCSRYLTDGFIPASSVRRLADVDDPIMHAELLVAHGLWEQAKGGYRVHDYLDYQQSKERVTKTREVRAEVGRKGGQQKAANALANSQNFARDVAKQTPSRSRLERDTEPNGGYPPTPLRGSRFAAAVGAERFKEIATNFTEANPQLTASWLNNTIAAVEADLPPEQVERAIEATALMTVDAFSTPNRIQNPRAWAEKRLAEAAAEARSHTA